MHTHCAQCDKPFDGSHRTKKFCDVRCKRKYRWAHGKQAVDGGHVCRVCGTWFPISKDQGNKWLCSPECRRASVAKSVREFHLRQPGQEAVYRERTKAKKLPDSNLVRFRRHNPDAPTACESCGERRVLDVAHKPHCRRHGEWRSSRNCRWPEMVWVLCPTCHALIDRMSYPPEELGLNV
jgi:hypothetical protein